jgi:LacI family transcriptional regulator
MVTIRDVARAAGVSVSTVSHALSGNRTISQATKDRVRLAVEELGYEPNPSARALRSSTTGVIGFFAHDITEVFAARIIQGAERIARERNAYLLFTSGTEFGEDLGGAIDFLCRRRVDGILLAYGVRREVAEEELGSLVLPCVTINLRVHASLPSVLPDDLAGGRAAAHYLLERGSSRPCVIAGPPDRLASRERLRGFMEAMASSGIAFDRGTQVVHGDFTSESGAPCLDSLLASCPGMDSVFCANDYMAAGAINRALVRGLSIPRDLRVLGYDDREFASFWPIPISSFALPLEAMGETGMSMLFGSIEGRQPEPLHALLPARLIERGST